MKLNANIIKNSLMKNSPEILLGAGIACAAAGTIVACKATLMIPEIKEEYNAALYELEKYEAAEEVDDGYVRKETRKLSFHTGVRVVRIFAVPAALELMALLLVLKSHGVIKDRYLGASSECAALAAGFSTYRKLVREKYGDKIDQEFRFGVHTEEIEETKIDSKGKEKIVKKKVKVIDGQEISQYAKFFDAASCEWQDDPEYNLMFLKKMEQVANDMLHGRGPNGILFLNEVYDLLDIPRTKAGQLCGWINNPDDPDSDDYVDFGIFNKTNEYFVNGYDDVVLLDFNCAANVYEKL